MKYKVFYDKTNGNIVYSTSVYAGNENIIAKDFEVDEGKTLVSVDITKKEHEVVSEDNPISNTARIEVELRKAKETIDKLTKSTSTLENSFLELTGIVVGGESVGDSNEK